VTIAFNDDLDGCPAGPGPCNASLVRTRMVHRTGKVRSWPLLVLAMPAAVAVWSGWVGIGQMAGFGVVRPLPGIWNSLQVDTAVTLPVGVEAYAAMALHAWLTSSRAVSSRTRRFAMWSAISSLTLGAAGQVAYHLLAEAHVTRAPWQVTTLVASLPVVVLGLGTALAHMLHADAVTADRPVRLGPETALDCPDPSVLDQEPDPGPRGRPDADQSVPVRDLSESAGQGGRLSEAQAAASELAAAGQRISRRSLRAAGIRGSNAELSELARSLHAGPTGKAA
jgi:hypothetical protein